MRGLRGRRAARAVALVAVGATLALACSPRPRVTGPPPLSAGVREFLPEPWSAEGGTRSEPWGGLYDRLLRGEEPSRLAAEIERLLPPGATFATGRLLLAEARLAGEQWSEARAAVGRLPEPARRSPAAVLVGARALEGLGDAVEAYSLYRSLGDGTPAARRRADALESAATEQLAERVEQALARGHAEAAARDLARLVVWRPLDRRTLDLQRRTAASLGDDPGELAALRALAAGEPPTVELAVRRAELELEVGEIEDSLRLLEELAARWPEDAAVAAALERGRFGWRLRNAPEPVQKLAQKPQLSRADLARLLYWLVPGVRTGRGGVGRIASDAVGHAAQEEIVRVVNQGLLRLDETLHRFEPDRPARRVEAIEAILRASRPAKGSLPCVGAIAAAERWSREGTCAAGVACGLLASEADCLAGGPLSGAEALGWLRDAAAEAGRER
jgi:hypothetical protein